jgi:hypothetical protein
MDQDFYRAHTNTLSSHLVLALQVHALYGKGQEEEYIPEEHKQDFEIADKYSIYYKIVRDLIE